MRATQRGISSAHALDPEMKHTCGICEPEGDGLVFDVAHVADGDLACVVGKVFGSEVLDLQHLGLTLRETGHDKGRLNADTVNRYGWEFQVPGSGTVSAHLA